MKKKGLICVFLRRIGVAGLFLSGLVVSAVEANEMEDTSVMQHNDVHTDPLVSMDPQGKLVYTPYTDKGDRIIDYSYAGYKASEEPIPFVRVVETLDPPPGDADSRERIQAALDRVAALKPDENGFRGAVFLSKGTYTLNGGLQVKSGVVLRGEGQRGFGTQVIVHNPGGAAIVLGRNFSGVEGMSISSTADAGALDLGVEIRNAENAWVRGIRVVDASRAAVSVSHSRQATVRDSLFQEPVDIGEDSHRILVYNCSFGEQGSYRESERRFEQQLIDRVGERQATLVLAETLSKASLPMKVMFPRPVVDGVVQGPVPPEQMAFEEAEQRTWKTVMSDEGTGDWTEQWFLDGEGSTTVTTSPEGMELKALNDHMVLWTKESFTGDLKIEYEFTRTDVDGGGVCIIYIQATGRGDEGYEKDITEWNDYREEPGMGKYFQNMHLYHVSYACGYVRGRRYMPDIRKMNTFTELTPEFIVYEEDLFEPGVPYRITLLKTDNQIRMKAVGPEKAMYFMLDNEKCPPITEGRIGLRQMQSRHSRYKDFKVSVPGK